MGDGIGYVSVRPDLGCWVSMRRTRDATHGSSVTNQTCRRNGPGVYGGLDPVLIELPELVEPLAWAAVWRERAGCPFRPANHHGWRWMAAGPAGGDPMKRQRGDLGHGATPCAVLRCTS